MKKLAGTLLHCLIGSLAVGVSAWLNQSPEAPTARVASPHASLGDPVRREVMIRREGYDVLYDGVRHNPLFVQYRITPADLEAKVDRPAKFYTDRSMPAAWRTYPDDYGTTGYDRGHLAACADQRRNIRVAEDSMLTSNICPQTPALNRGTWRQLESHVRMIAEGSEEAIICTGPIFDSEHCAIGHNDSILVPGGYWKAIAYRQNANWYVRFWVVSQADAGLPLDRLIVTQQTVEQLCGFELFPALNIPAETKREMSNLRRESLPKAQFVLGEGKHRLAHFDPPSACWQSHCVVPYLDLRRHAFNKPSLQCAWRHSRANPGATHYETLAWVSTGNGCHPESGRTNLGEF